jgi:hypothetical protein
LHLNVVQWLLQSAIIGDVGDKVSHVELDRHIPVAGTAGAKNVLQIEPVKHVDGRHRLQAEKAWWSYRVASLQSMSVNARIVVAEGHFQQ